MGLSIHRLILVLAATVFVAACDETASNSQNSPAYYVSLDTGDTVTLGEDVFIFGSIIDQQEPCDLEGLIFCREGGVIMYLPSIERLQRSFVHNDIIINTDNVSANCESSFIRINTETELYSARYYFSRAYGLVYFDFIYNDTPETGDLTTFHYVLVGGDAINYHELACNGDL